MQQQPVVKRQSTFPLISKHFNTHPQDAINFYQGMQSQMQDFVEAFRKRIQIEVIYSKNLMQVSKLLDKHIKPGTDLSTSFICSAFKVEHEQRSRQALQLAQSLKTQIQVICSEFLKNQTTGLKKLEKEVKQYYNHAQFYSENHRKAFQLFQNINKQMEEATILKNITRYTAGIVQDKKSKLLNKANQKIKQNKSYEKAYLDSVKQYNNFATSYNKQIYNQLDEIQKTVRQQVDLQGDCIRKLIVAEVSMFKNIQYDLLNICKQMEVLDTQRNVQAFVQQEMNSTNHRIVQEDKDKQQVKRPTSIEALQSQPLPQKPIVGKSMLSESIYFVEQEYFSWMLSNKNNKKLRQLISRIWKHLKQDLASKHLINHNTQKNQQQSKQQQSGPKTQDQAETPIIKQQKSWQEQLKQTIAQFKIISPPSSLLPNQIQEKALNHEKIYEIFMEILTTIALLWNNQSIDSNTFNQKLSSLQIHLSQHHLYRLAAMIFIQEFRQQKQLTIKPNNTKMCAKIIRTVINQSQQKNDVFIIRSILSLIFTFYWLEDKAKKIMNLIPQIYQLQIWKKADFWQAAIFETTLQELISFTAKKEESQAESFARQKNIVFNQLASYCNNMIMLGMTSKNVKLTVGRFCRLYELTQQQNKQLSKMINNTMKQYKQVYALLSVKVEKEKPQGD